MKKLGLVARFAFLFIFVATPATYAATYAAADEAADEESPIANVESAVAKVVSIFKSRITVLDRQTMTFHYGTTDVVPQISSHQVIADWAGLMAEPFFDTGVVTGDMQGAGFYVATDPQSTRNFGSTSPLLFAIPIKKGTLILDMSSDRETEDQDLTELRSLASDFQCSESTEKDEMYNIEAFTHIFRGSKKIECRQIVVEAFKKLNVEAILYSYSSDPYSVNCRYRFDAFNIVSEKAIGVEGNGLFWETGSYADKTLARMISQSYRDAQIDFSTQYGNLFNSSTYEIPGSLKDLFTFERSAQSWRKRNLLRCGPLWSIEGREPNTTLLVMSLKTTFSDSETQRAILDWQIAYRLKYVTHDYDIGAYQRIAAVEKMSYLQTSLAKDFSQFEAWKTANDLYANYNLKDFERDAEAGRLLGEKPPNVRTDDITPIAKRELKKIYDPSHPQPGLYGNILKLVGFGPELIRLKISQSLGYYGASPILATGVPMDASVDSSADLAKNKREFLKIVRPCTAMMNDRAISLESIQASPCAVRTVRK